MKKLFSFLFVVIMVLMVVVACVMAQEANRYDRSTVRPAWCPNMVVTSSNTGLGDFILVVAANYDRNEGYVVNLGSYPVRFVGVFYSTDAVSGYVTSTTTIVADGGYISATNTTDDSDIFYFRRGDTVYTGPLYLAAEVNDITLDIVVVEINKN